MAAARWLVVLGSAVAAAVFIVVLYAPTTDKCSAAPLILEDPIAALLSDDSGLPTAEAQERELRELRESNVIIDFYRGPCNKDNWWGPVTIWLLLWGPICAVLVGVGYIAARHGGPQPLVKGASGGSVAVGLVLATFLTLEHKYSGHVATQSILNAIALTGVGAVISTASAYVWRRHA